MPQDGSYNYQYPPGTPGVPDQTIESEAYNTFLDDLVNNDLNIPRPVHRGGTGANNAVDAMTTLGGELASQLVSNFDSHVWRPGSFRAPTSASGSPIAGHAFTGIAYSFDPLQVPALNQNVVIHARDWSDINKPGRIYIREKKAGVWDAWKGEDRIIVSATPPNLANIPDGGLWWDTDNGILYISYNDGNSTAWVQVVAVPYVDTELFVKKEGDTMLGLLTLSGDPVGELDAVPKRYAAPLDALAYSGMQINGSMEVSQENGTTGTNVSGGYACDGWRFVRVGTMSCTAAQVDNPAVFNGFPKFLAIGIATAQASLGAGDAIFVEHNIEGFRTARLAWSFLSPKPITIGFWSANQIAGVYSVAVRNAAGNRSYATTYTQAVAGVAQYNVITIPGDTVGSYNVNNLTGIAIYFTLAAGSSFIAPSANTWYAAGYIAAPGQINGVATTSGSLRITGVVVLPGIHAPTAAQSPLIMRPYDQELVTCQRYYQKFNVLTHSTAWSTTANQMTLSPVMRAAPTVSLDTSGAWAAFDAHTVYQSGPAVGPTGSMLTADARL